MIDRLTVDKILEAANIVDVVSDFVTLKRAGANLKGLCPFHDDRTPSFMVSPAKNYCKCFACGKGGFPVGFIMEHEQLSYPDALRYLAKKYGIEIKEKELTPEEKQSQNDRDSMFIVNEWARDWFMHELHETPDGRAIGLAYFRGRGFRDDIIQKFQVGFCPNSRTHTLGADALKAGYQEKYLINTINPDSPQNSIGTGLCIKGENGQLRDRFWGRVMWPIFSVSGRVAGFGGRVLDAATKGVNVKYQNSPESIVYSKRKELFGLFQAKEAIRKQNLCYLVEGYTDVMAMHQHGVENVVASSGTALTTQQIQLIHRMTDNITVIYDGDEAGIHASERGIDMLLAEGMNVKLLLLPDGDDPDSFARKHNAQEFQEYLKSHQVDFINYRTSHLAKNSEEDPQKMGELIHNVAESIAVIPDEITRVLYIRQAAQKLMMEERIINNAVNQEIQRLREEKQKERDRELRRSSLAQGSTSSSTPGEETAKTATPVEQHSNGTTSNKIAVGSEALVQLIIKYGEKLMCYIEDEEGNSVPLSVAEFIDYSLKDDDMELNLPLHRQILDECIQHVKEEGFHAEQYFTNHPNHEVSTLAFRLCTDQTPMNEQYIEEDKDDQQLDKIVPKIIASYKLRLVQAELKAMIEQTKQPSIKNNKEAYRKLVVDFNMKNKLAQDLAKQSGERVILK